MKKCVISFADEALNFRQGLRRIEDTLAKTHFDGDYIPYEDYPAGCPTHDECPYGFKAFVLEVTFARGYDRVLYLDSSAVVLKPLDPIFECIASRGYFFQKQKDPIGRQCKSAVLTEFGMDRDQAMGLPAHQSAILGLDRADERAMQWLARLKQKVLERRAFDRAGGSFDRYWRQVEKGIYGHRSQAVTSLLAWELGLLPFDFGWFSERPYERERFRPEHVPESTIVWLDRRYVKPRKRRFWPWHWFW